MKSNVVIIGFMGVGKTEVSKALAKRLSMELLDTDALIEKKEGMTVSEIFAKKGEPYFRDLETKLLEELDESGRRIISTGGGMVLREDNVKRLKELGPLILLTASPEVIEKRLSKVADRPLLNVPDRGGKIREILDVRGPIYDRVADFTVDTGITNIKEAVEKILDYLKRSSK